MCGIFGVITKTKVNKKHLEMLADYARQRGRDSSGLVTFKDQNYSVVKADYDIKRLRKQTDIARAQLVMGHSRLITNGLADNQPVVRNGLVLLHNGIVVNEEAVWSAIGSQRELQIDSEAIVAIAEKHLAEGLLQAL